MSKADDLTQYLNDLRKKAVASSGAVADMGAVIKAFGAASINDVRAEMTNLGVDLSRAKIERDWYLRDKESVKRSAEALAVALEAIERDLANMIRLVQEATQR